MPAPRKRPPSSKPSGKPRPPGARPRNTSWDPLAAWYDGWVGEGGSQYHTKLAIPTVINLLRLKPGESVLDIGAGQGVLAQYVVDAGGRYTGVDASERLISMARRRHGKLGTFIVGDARALPGIPKIQPASFDAVVFLLSIQDMDPLEEVLESAAWALRAGGRAVLLMTHPAFRIPRQSGWGWDENRKLQYRRLDRYLTPLPVPLKPFPGEGGVSRSFHRPLHEYVNGLARCGLLVDQMREIPAFKRGAGKTAKAEETASEEFPLFLGLRAVKAP